jgi:hypothetical protein
MIVRTFDELELEGAGGGIKLPGSKENGCLPHPLRKKFQKNYLLCFIVFSKGMVGIMDRLKSVIIWVRKQDVSQLKPNNFYENSGYSHP